MGAKWARKIQWGTEAATAQGTIVAATSIARAVGVLELDEVVNRHVMDVNRANGTTDQYTVRKGGKLEMSFDPLSFEQLCDVLDCGISTATASVDGAGSGYIREYPFPTTSTVAVSTKTIEAGDDAEAEVMDYSFVQRVTIAGQSGQQITGSASWYGSEIVPQAYTAALTLPSVSPMIFGNAKLYIDATTATIGTTLIDCTVLGFNFDLDTGLKPKFCANGGLVFGEIKRGAFVPKLSLTLEHNANSIAQKAAFKANTPKQIKLLIEGATLASAGTTYSKKSVIINLAGVWNSVSGLGEMDENNTLDLEFEAAYNSDAALFGNVIVVTELVTLP